jgi:flagellar hook-associated protein 3 FlgL
MTRISTSTTYESALLNILSAQNRLGTAENQVSSGKVADDLKGYGVRADSLTAARSLKSRLDGYVESSRSLTSTLDVQDHALEQLASAALSARGAVAEALATGSAVGLMASLEGYLGQAIDALNTEYQGRHLFAGGQTDGEPVGALALADLTAAPTIASLFSNDQLELTRRLDDKMSMKIGMLANELGEPLFTALEGVQAIHQGGLGPFNGSLTEAQAAALEALISSFDQAWGGINEKVAENGGMQIRLEAVQTSLLDRQTALEGVLGEMVDVDMAAAVSRLQLAQTALQASANVFATLTGSSLLNVLGGR